MCYTNDNTGYYKLGEMRINGKRFEVLEPDGLRFCDECGNDAEQVGERWLCWRCAADLCPDCGADVTVDIEFTHHATRYQPAEYVSRRVCTECDLDEVE